MSGKQWDRLGQRFPESRPVPADPERSRHPDVRQGPAYPQAGGLRGPPAAPLARRAEPAVGAFRGARAAGAQWVGPSGPGRSGAAGRRGAGRGGRRPRRQQLLRCDQARQRGEREVRVAQLRHVSVPAVSGSRGPGGGWSGGSDAPLRPPSPQPAPPRRSRICCPGGGPVPHTRAPGRALSFLPSPWARRTQLRPTKAVACGPTAPGAASFQPTASPRRPVPRALEWARPGPWHGRFPGAPLPSPLERLS